MLGVHDFIFKCSCCFTCGCKTTFFIISQSGLIVFTDFIFENVRDFFFFFFCPAVFWGELVLHRNLFLK